VGLRILGGIVAIALLVFAIARFRRGLLRRGEMLVVTVFVLGLSIAALAPDLYDPVLSTLGFERGDERRIIGLLVISNLFTLILVFRGFSRDDQVSGEIGDLVDYMALRRLEDDGWEAMPGSCAVVMPAFNEAENIAAVLAEMPEKVAHMPVMLIVVADGCTDDTESVVRGLGANVIRRELRRGSGAAVRLGYLAALGAGADVVVTIDADGQHDPREMESLVAPLLAGDADMVQGSRVLGTFEVESRIRRSGVLLFSKILTFLGRTRISDPSTGYRAITAEALKRLDLRQDQFYVSEVILDASHKGLSVVEVPITLRRRASGATKKPSPLWYAYGFSKAILGTWFRGPARRTATSTEPRWITNSGIAAPGSKGDASTDRR
jgi:hypothetical protein